VKEDLLMEMKTRLAGDVNILEIAGRFDTNTVPPVAAWLEHVTVAPKSRVLVNLAETTFVDSTALATLVQALKPVSRYKAISVSVACGVRST